MIDRLKQVLRESDYSATSPRQTIFTVIADAGPLTPAAVATICAPQIDRATAYRTIGLFEKLGIVNRLGDNVELSEIFTPHHHHATCQNCGMHIDITSPDLERMIAHISKESDFLALGHVLEISGYCKQCQFQQV